MWAIIRTYAPRYGLDPRAVAAIAMNESGGRFGAVGDNGTSFGPWQLHVGGALPAGKTAAWANSLPGILYALQQMGSVARGLHGQAAVNNIAYRFERPADPAAEARVAMGYYNQRGFAPGSPVYSGGALPGGGSGNLTLQPPHPQVPFHPVFTPPVLNLPPLQQQTPAQTLSNLFAQQSLQPQVEAPQMPTVSMHPELANQLDALHSALLRA